MKIEIQYNLDDFKGAVLSIDGAKKGDNHIISMRMELANQKFIPNESSILDDAIELLAEVMFQPPVKEDAFHTDVFNRESETLKQKIAAIIDNKMSYANMRLIDEMCEGETYQLHVHGYEEDLRTMTPENLYNYYQQLIKDDDLDIYVLGDFDTEEMKSKIVALIKRDKQNISPELQSNSPAVKQQDKPQVVIENKIYNKQNFIWDLERIVPLRMMIILLYKYLMASLEVFQVQSYLLTCGKKTA